MNNNKSGHLMKKLIGRSEFGVLLPLVILCIIITIKNPNFMAVNNLVDIFRSTSYTLVVAIPLTYLMIAGGMDLSIGAVTSLGSVMTAICLSTWSLPIWLSVIIALVVGAAVGLFNGYITNRFNFPAFIVTLGTQYIVNGFCSIVTNNTPVAGIPDEFLGFGQDKIAGIYYTIIMVVILAVIGHIVLQRTKYGRKIFAVGGNAETAKLSGISVNKIQISTYVLTSIFSALAGVAMCSRFSSGQPTAGSGTEMTIMAAVIIGGTSLYGGIGSIAGSAIGCLLLSVITNGLIFMKVNTIWQNLIFGVVLLLSIGLDYYRRKVNESL